MTRIQPARPPYTDEAAERLETMMPPGVPPIGLFRTFVRNLPMTTAMGSWGGYELSKRLSLTMRDREIVIDRTCARCRWRTFRLHAVRTPLCWGQFWRCGARGTARGVEQRPGAQQYLGRLPVLWRPRLAPDIVGRRLDTRARCTRSRRVGRGAPLHEPL